VQSHWQGWLRAAAATLATLALVLLDVTDRGIRRWWDSHALTTDTVAGLLVLLITFLVVDQVVRRRQIVDRSRAIAAQAAIMAGQATRSVQAVSAALDGSGDHGTAADELQTYMMMLLVGAPLLIDADVSRNFLQAAQNLGGQMALAMSQKAKAPDGTSSSARLDDAVKQFREASAPLLRVLNLDESIITSGAQYR
jgi:hypothetical protein